MAVFVLAKSSEAPDAQITVEPATVGFGADAVDGTATTPRVILITNDGQSDLQIGGLNADINISDLSPGDFEVLPTVKDAITGLPLPGDLNTGVTLGAGETAEIQVSFNASAQGARDEVLRLTDDAGNLIQNVNLTGTGVDQLNPDAVANGCTIIGTNDGETLTGTSRRDVICAMGGRDTVKPLAGNDKVVGGRGNDVVRSSAGRDTLIGGIGGDRLTDKAGRRGDRLFGKSGKDTLNAKDGRRGDLLNGGPRRDRAFKDKGDITRRI